MEDMDRKLTSTEKEVKALKEHNEELQDQLSEETKAKITASNKSKQLQDEVERLNVQLEDEEEAKTALQTKTVQLNQQVCYQSQAHCYINITYSRFYCCIYLFTLSLNELSMLFSLAL